MLLLLIHLSFETSYIKIQATNNQNKSKPKQPTLMTLWRFITLHRLLIGLRYPKQRLETL